MHFKKDDRGRFSRVYVKSNGDTELPDRSTLNDREINNTQDFIKGNHLGMYVKWSAKSEMGF